MINNEVEKIALTLVPDTTQVAYLGKSIQTLIFEVFKFKDGSIRVTIPTIDAVNALDWSTARVDAYIENMDDLMIVGQIKNILSRKFKNKQYLLNITSPMYTRYDRPMLGFIDGFGLEVFAEFTNSMNYDHVSFSDPHSQVTLDLVANSFGISQSSLRGAMLPQHNIGLISPDKGASHKIKDPVIQFDKTRDLSTGHIIKFDIAKIDADITNYSRLVVSDDICEGGRTFIEVMKSFEENVKSGSIKLQDGVKLDLYVTHGLFTNNALPKLLEKFNQVHAFYVKQSTYDELDDELKARFNVHTLIKNI